MKVVRYILENYGLNGGTESETHALYTLDQVKAYEAGEFSICKDLLTGEVFEPCEKYLHN